MEVFFENHQNSLAYRSLLKNKKTPESIKKRYPFTFRGKIFFLVDYGFIDPDLTPEYFFIKNEGDNHSIAHAFNKGGMEEYIDVIKIYLNEILKDFLTRTGTDKNYLIPTKVIVFHDSEIYRRYSKKIKTFWNIKTQETRWFKKYATILTYIFTLLSSLLIPLLCFILCSVEIRKTLIFAFTKKVKTLRIILFSTIFISSIFINYHWLSIYDQQAYRSFFDRYPIEKTHSSIALLDIEKHQNLDYNVLENILDYSHLKKGQQIKVATIQTFRNAANNPINFALARIRVVEKVDRIIFYGFLNEFGAISGVKDSTIIKIEYPYQINFNSGLLFNYQGRHQSLVCEDYFIEEFVDYNYIQNGIVLPELSNYNDGWCDIGSIQANFIITKL